MTTTPDEQLAALSQTDQTMFLQYQVNVLAWLHAELVHELQTMIRQMIGPNGVNTGNVQAIRQRAARIARLRAKQIKENT